MPRPQPRVVLVGDIGGVDTLHVGDEAMFGADLALVRTLLPDAHCLAVSADPGHTESVYGLEAVARADGTRAAQAADLLVVTGGGNLNSAFSALLAERLELARATSEAGGTVVLLGQMLGPSLEPSDADRVAELLDRSAFIGVRDAASLAVARHLGADDDRVVQHLDDAWLVGSDLGADPPLDLEEDSYAVVTLHPDGRIVSPAAIGELASQLDDVARATGTTLVLVPHCRASDGPRGTSDEDVGAAIAERFAAIGTPHRSLPVLSPSIVAGLTRRSTFVITSRYHPLVFATSAGRPALALWSDSYVHSKQRGVLAMVGLDDWMLSLDDVFERGMAPAVAELWARRLEIGVWLAAQEPRLHAMQQARDRALLARLRAHGFDVAVDAPRVVAPSVEESSLESAPRPAANWSQSARPVPRAPRRCTVLDRLRLEAHRDHFALVARVRTRDAEEAEVRMRVHEPALADRFDASATPFLPSMLLLAASSGTDLLVDGPVDASALDRAQQVVRLLGDWWGWRVPELDLSAMVRTRGRAPGVGLWFSRGVDSTDTLARSLEGSLVEGGEHLTVTHLLGLDWIDPPYATPMGPAIWADTAAVAARVGLPLVRMTTDLRTVLEPFADWRRTHGAVLAGCGLLLGPLLGTVMISASAPGPHPRPQGSHPQLDPLFGTATTAVAHVGRVPRSEKVRHLVAAGWPLDELKVCWEVDGTDNCGRCAKCLATMTVLSAAGALERCRCFAAPLTAEAVRAIARTGPVTIGPHTAADAVAVAATLDPELGEAWREVGARVEHETGIPMHR